MINGQDEADLWSGFIFFSNVDYLFPPSIDKEAEKHFRVAVHHIAPEYIKKSPITPPLSSFKRELKKRNKYVYFPNC